MKQSLRVFLLPLVVLYFTSAYAAPETLDLDKYRGQIVLLDFWASWCAPCRKSFPWLNAMQEKYRDQGLVVLGVNVDRHREEADRFLSKYPADFAIVYDGAGELAAFYDILGMPSSVILDRHGQVVGGHAGFREKKRSQYEDELIEHLRDASHTLDTTRPGSH